MTVTNSKWTALPAATVEDLQAELARRQEEAERAAAQAAEERKARESERKRLIAAAPSTIAALHKRLVALKADDSRPTPEARNRARGALMRGEWALFTDHDPVTFELSRLLAEAGALVAALHDAPEDLLADADALECQVFAAGWARVHEIAGVSA